MNAGWRTSHLELMAETVIYNEVRAPKCHGTSSQHTRRYILRRLPCYLLMPTRKNRRKDCLMKRMKLRRPRAWCFQKQTRNCATVMCALKSHKNPANEEMLQIHEKSVCVFGVPWNLAADQFSFSVDRIIDFMKAKLDTKCFILKAASKIFDALGRVTPYRIVKRIILQKLWNWGIRWEQIIPHGLREK